VAIRRRRIESLVQGLLATHKIKEAPVPVEKIAKAQGARIFYQSLDNDMSGFLYRDKAGGHRRQYASCAGNFTTAHELGHLLLHDQEQLHVDHGFRVRLRDDMSSQGTDEAEREANLFAASLLMPKEFIEADLASEDYFDLLDDGFLQNLARKYGVSAQALVNRLKNLGYIQE
jgi:Zn-dependent peptidase ImmA (M78 family)